MTLADLESTGQGSLEARLVIEGCTHEFVTRADMEQALADGRERIAVLKRSGITIGEKLSMKAATIRGEEWTATLVDRNTDHAVTQALVRRPSRKTYLASNLNDSSLTVDVLSTAALTAGDVVHLGTEAMKIDTVDSGTQFTAVSRGYWDTTAQAHYAADGDLLPRPAVYLDRPRYLERRRAFLYLYGAGDDPQGAGTLRWRGVCKTDARLGKSLSSYQIKMGGLSELLKQDVGRELEREFQPRGIYYPYNSPLRITIQIASTIHELSISGFFETNQALGDEVDTQISALSISEAAITFEPDDEGWHLGVRPTADGEVIVIAQSPVDGYVADRYRVSDGEFIGYGYGLEDNVDYVVVGRPADDQPGFRQVPRGIFTGHTVARQHQADPAAGNRSSDIYLGLVGSLPSRISAIEYQPSEGDAEIMSVSVVSQSNRSVRAGGETRDRAFWPGNLPTIRLARQYAQGDLGDLLTALTTDGPDYANLGSSPLITTADIDLSAITAAVDEAVAGRSWAADRRFVTSNAVQLAKMLSEEMKLIGVIPFITLAGKLSLRTLRVPTSTEPTATAIDKDAVLVLGSDGWPTWERNKEGSVNTIQVSTGYNPAEDEHQGVTVTVTDAAGLAESKGERGMEIAPYSFTTAAIPYEQVADMLRPLLGLYTGQHAVIRCGVPWSHFGTLCGSLVTVTLADLPDTTTGERGVTTQPGIVVGRRFDVERGVGTLEIFLVLEEYAGYAPSAYVTTENNTGGNTWALTVTAALFGTASMYRDNEDPSDHFASGDKIRLIELDASSPVTREGTVDSVGSATSITVTLDASWTPGSSDWALEYDIANTPVVTRQEGYAFFADSGAEIDFDATADAKVWAP